MGVLTVVCFACGFRGTLPGEAVCLDCGEPLKEKPAARWLLGDVMALAAVAWMILAVPMSVQPQRAQAGSYNAAVTERGACQHASKLVAESWRAFHEARYAAGIAFANEATWQARTACDSLPVQHAMLGFALSARAQNEHVNTVSNSLDDLDAAMDQLDVCESDPLLKGTNLESRCEEQEAQNYDAATRWDGETPASV